MVDQLAHIDAYNPPPVQISKDDCQPLQRADVKSSAPLVFHPPECQLLLLSVRAEMNLHQNALSGNFK
jgi:hypothetical protein